MKRIVHLTDIHYSGSWGNQELVIKEALNDIKNRFSTSTPDLFIISGDLVQNPDSKNIFASFRTKIIEPLSTHFGLPFNKFVICPGNHDFSFTYANSKKNDHAAIQSARTQNNCLKFNEDENLPFTNGVFKRFFELAASLNQKWQNPYIRIQEVTDNILVVSINSAFACSLEGSEEDKGKLLVGLNGIETAFSTIDDSKFVVAQIHHPIDQLITPIRDRLSSLLNRYCDVLFCGHIHNAQPYFQIGGSSQTTILQSGALYSHKNYFKGYGILSFDENDHSSQRLEYRTFWDKRSEFGPAEDVAESGKLYSPTTSAELFERVRRSDPETYAIVALDAAREMRDSLILSSSERHYVEPILLERNSHIEDDETPDEKSKREIFIDDISDSNASFVITSVAEGGGSTLLREVAARVYERASKNETLISAIYLDARNLKLTPAQFDRALRVGIPDSIKQEFSVEKILNESFVTLLVDNLPKSTDFFDKLMKLTLDRYPNSRVVAVLDAEELSPDGLGMRLNFKESVRQIHLMPLDRTRARKIIQNHDFSRSDINLENLLDEVVTRFKELGIPLTHVFLKIYISVIDASPRFNPINTSTLVEYFVEGVLVRMKSENVFRGEFDFDNQRSALGALAEFMVRNASGDISYVEAVSTIEKHLLEIGISTDIEKIFATFLKSRILKSFDGRICFSSSVFLNYFISIRMRDRKEFFDHIFSPDRSLNYISAIEIYCGLNRSDTRALQFSKSTFDSVISEIMPTLLSFDSKSQIASLPINSSELGSVMEKEAEMSEAYRTDRDSAASKLSEQEGPVVGKPAVVSEQRITNSAFRAVLAVRLLSVVLKNLENVPRNLKDQPLKELVRTWGFFASIATYGLVILAQSGKSISVGDLEISLILPDKIDEDFIRRLASQIPVMVSDRVRIDLGTQKLSASLGDIHSSELIDSFICETLLIDISGEEGIEATYNLAEKFSDSPFLSRVLYNQTLNRYVRIGSGSKKHSREEDLHRRRLIGTLHANCLGLKGKERVAEIKRRTSQLELENNKRTYRDTIEKNKTV